MQSRLLTMRVQLRASVRGASASRRAFSSISVNPEEIHNFSAVGKGWWDSSSAADTVPLHAMNPTRVSFIRQSIAQTLSRENLPVASQIRGLKILDVGCGRGILSESLARLGASVTAIDPSARKISVALEHSRSDPLTSTIKYQCATVEQIVASGQKFDVVCSLEVLERVEMPMAFLGACGNCLSDNGSMFISTVNRTNKSHFISILGAMGMVPIGTRNWQKFVTPEELTPMLCAKGSSMVVKNVQGLVIAGIDPFSKALMWKLSSTDLDYNYIVHAVKDKQ
jgi:ubiquinone biosynthesis O-methyltransferase